MIDTGADIRHAHDVGFVAHLTKPVRLATLIDAVGKALDRGLDPGLGRGR